MRFSIRGETSLKERLIQVDFLDIPKNIQAMVTTKWTTLITHRIISAHFLVQCYYFSICKYQIRYFAYSRLTWIIHEKDANRQIGTLSNKNFVHNWLYLKWSEQRHDLDFDFTHEIEIIWVVPKDQLRVKWLGMVIYCVIYVENDRIEELAWLRSRLRVSYNGTCPISILQGIIRMLCNENVRKLDDARSNVILRIFKYLCNFIVSMGKYGETYLLRWSKSGKMGQILVFLATLIHFNFLSWDSIQRHPTCYHHMSIVNQSVQLLYRLSRRCTLINIPWSLIGCTEQSNKSRTTPVEKTRDVYLLSSGLRTKD